jgi:hypothetical protein
MGDLMEHQRHEHAVHRLVGQWQGLRLAQDPPERQGMGLCRRMVQQVCCHIHADDLRLEALRQRSRKTPRPTPEIEHPLLGGETRQLDKVRQPQI